MVYSGHNFEKPFGHGTIRLQKNNSFYFIRMHKYYKRVVVRESFMSMFLEKDVSRLQVKGNIV